MSDIKLNVIYIDDEEASRDVFSEVIDDLYDDKFNVVSISPNKNLADMISVISDIQDVKSIIIDEKLSVSAKTEYKGSELSEELRNVYEIMPIYILTSQPSSLEPICGSVEYVLDKGQIEEGAYKEHVKKLLSRHIANTDALVSEKKEKYDRLLTKSMSEGLSEVEISELESLELFRIKPLLKTESLVGEKDLEALDENNKLLGELEELLSSMGEKK